MLDLANDPEVALLLTAEIAAEAARIEHHRCDLARHRGVTWSGLGPAPAEPRSPASLQAAAEAHLAARRLWSTSPKGKLLSAIAACQAAAHRAHAVGERARAGAARDEPLEWCRLALLELSNETQTLMTNLAEAQRAISESSQLARAATGARSGDTSQPALADHVVQHVGKIQDLVG